MRRIVIAALTLGLVGLVPVAATASNVHLKGKSGPAFTDNGLSLSATGDLAGLGNANLVVKLTATGNARATCTNPSGSNQPPGQNRAPVTLTGTQVIPASEIKNGNVSFNVRTARPVTPIPGAPGCPNANWTERITDVLFTSATIRVEQPAGTVVLTVRCTFSSPTTNGSVPSGNVSCTSS